MNTTAKKSVSIPLPKIIVVKKELGTKDWNKSLPVPLVPDDKVIVHADQSGVSAGYVKVKHGGTVSIFSKSHFLTLGGKEVSKCS